MSEGFSISVFAESGDPQGIRHVDKTNWSGYGVVFPRELFPQLKDQEGFDKAGVYILVGNVAEDTIYIGEADPVGERLKAHFANKKDWDWDWGVYFFDKNGKIGKTEVQFLECKLVKLAKEYNRAILLNKNNPTAPTMSRSARATADGFLANMRLILPMLGIHAFLPPPAGSATDEPALPESNSARNAKAFDTIVVPARSKGFKQYFLGKNCWFAIRINAKHHSKLKYIAVYQVAPVAAITHLAEIDTIKPYQNTGKYLIRFKSAAMPIGPIPRANSNTTSNLQSPRYALREKLVSAKSINDIWATS